MLLNNSIFTQFSPKKKRGGFPHNSPLPKKRRFPTIFSKQKTRHFSHNFSQTKKNRFSHGGCGVLLTADAAFFPRRMRSLPQKFSNFRIKGPHYKN